MNFVFDDLSINRNFTTCKDVVSSGIPRFTTSPLVTRFELLRGSSQDVVIENTPPNQIVLNFDELSITLNKFHPEDVEYPYVLSAGVHNSPDEWAGGELSLNPDLPPIFDRLNPTYKTDLQDGRAYLLIDSTFEGYHRDWLFDYFHSGCVKHNINPHQIIFVSGNMIIEERYEKWLELNPQDEKIKVIPYPHFEFEVCSTYSQLEDPVTVQDQIEYKRKHKDDIKTYACLNKRIKSHRVWFYTYLYKSGLLDKGLVSMNPFQEWPWSYEGKELDVDLVIESNKLLPLEVYNKGNSEFPDSYYIARINEQVFLDTWISVISEARFEDSEGTIFLSEKIFKPISCGQPFIILGNKGSLLELKKMGYKTFDKWWDESYDNLDNMDRMDAIIDVLKKIDSIEDKLSWFESMKSVLEHNKIIFEKNSFKSPPYAFIELNNHVKTVKPKRKLI